MSDTKPAEALSAKHQAFVDEYLKDRVATAAAKRCGLSPRSAAGLMSQPAIKAEIDRRSAAVATDAGVSLKSLIAEAEQAYETASAAGNAAGMVAATKLKADLSGHLDGSQQQTTEANIVGGTRDTAKAVIGFLVDSGYDVTVRRVGPGKGALHWFGDNVPPAAAKVDPFAPVVDEHQVLAPAPSELVDEDTLEREQPIATSSEPTPRRRLMVGECEVFDAGVYITLVQIPGSLEEKYEIRDNVDCLHAYKRNYDDAVVAANALVKHFKDLGGGPTIATESAFSTARTNRSGEQS